MLSCGSLDDDSMFTGLRLKGGRVGVLSRHNCTHPPTTCNCTSSLQLREYRQLPVTIMPECILLHIPGIQATPGYNNACLFDFIFREFRQLPVTIMPEVVQLHWKIWCFVHPLCFHCSVQLPNPSRLRRRVVPQCQCKKFCVFFR